MSYNISLPPRQAAKASRQLSGPVVSTHLCVCSSHQCLLLELLLITCAYADCQGCRFPQVPHKGWCSWRKPWKVMVLSLGRSGHTEGTTQAWGSPAAGKDPDNWMWPRARDLPGWKRPWEGCYSSFHLILISLKSFSICSLSNCLCL